MWYGSFYRHEIKIPRYIQFKHFAQLLCTTKKILLSYKISFRSKQRPWPAHKAREEDVAAKEI
jgi:hypothetical protein